VYKRQRGLGDVYKRQLLRKQKPLTLKRPSMIAEAVITL
jgi:hypothetical protein